MPIVELHTLDDSAFRRADDGVGERHLLINTRRQATSLLVDDELALSFDSLGRLFGAWIHGRNYRRGLDNRILEKQEGPQAGLSYRLRRELTPTETRAFLEQVRTRVMRYRAIMDDAHTVVTNAATPAECDAARAALDRALAWDADRLAHEADEFHRVYRPISILPPDQYLAVVLQATQGCSYNRCAFCGLYRDRTFRISGLDEFKHHVTAVRRLFGQAISLRRTVFLADANALVIPHPQLAPLFDVINAEFAIEPPDLERQALVAWRSEHPESLQGIYSFVDAFTTRRKSAAEFHDLRTRGLRRVYVGLESGDGDLLRFLGKPNSPEDVVRLVAQIKGGGVAVGVVILAGAGGERYAAAHVRHTGDVIRAMALDRKDLVYFSELVDYAGSTYSSLALAAGIRPLAAPEIENQVAEMRAAFAFGDAASKPQLSYYDVREFIY